MHVLNVRFLDGSAGCRFGLHSDIHETFLKDRWVHVVKIDSTGHKESLPVVIF